MSARKILHEGKYLRFVLSGRWEWIERTNCTGIVLIVAQDSRGRVLLIEQERRALGCAVIEFPAGLVNDRAGEKRESLKAAARRELVEETGYSAREFDRLTEGPVSAGLSSEVITFFLARGVKKIGTAIGDGHEVIKVHEVPLSKVDTWLKKKEKRGLRVDPKVYAGLYFLNRIRAR